MKLVGKYLTFRLPEEFGVRVSCIHEIRDVVTREFTQQTGQPGRPQWVRGATNWQGKIIPVVDLSLKLGLPGQEPTQQTLVVVAEVGSNLVGLAVGGLRGVVTFGEGDVTATDGDEPQGVVGIEKGRSAPIKLLDLKALFAGVELAELVFAE